MKAENLNLEGELRDAAVKIAKDDTLGNSSALQQFLACSVVSLIETEHQIESMYHALPKNSPLRMQMAEMRLQLAHMRVAVDFAEHGVFSRFGLSADTSRLNVAMA
jgi:hypothetical protein